MPIEIRELVITAEMQSSEPRPVSHTPASIDEQTRTEIIEEAVRQVMYLLERQKEP